MCRLTRITVPPVTRRFLDELEPRAREHLGRLGRLRRFDARAPLLLEGSLGGSVLILQSGRVKISTVADDGHGVLLALRGPGDVIGELAAIDGSAHSATGIALEPVDAQVIPAAEFRSFLTDEPGAALALLRVITARIRDADRMRLAYGAQDTLGRVAAKLCELAETSGESTAAGIRITLPITQLELAEWVAGSRESVARALASLRRRGVIATGRKEITVLDPEGLRRAGDAG
jgi:CRP-like cAMP-binding protein